MVISSPMEWPGDPGPADRLHRPEWPGRERQVAQHRAPAKRLQPGGARIRAQRAHPGPSEPTHGPTLIYSYCEREYLLLVSL